MSAAEVLRFRLLQVQREQATCFFRLFLIILSHVRPCAVLQSCADVTFWSELGNRKLDQYKLSETPVDIQGGVHAF